MLLKFYTLRKQGRILQKTGPKIQHAKIDGTRGQLSRRVGKKSLAVGKLPTAGKGHAKGGGRKKELKPGGPMKCTATTGKVGKAGGRQKVQPRHPRKQKKWIPKRNKTVSKGVIAEKAMFGGQTDLRNKGIFNTTTLQKSGRRKGRRPGGAITTKLLTGSEDQLTKPSKGRR